MMCAYRDHDKAMNALAQPITMINIVNICVMLYENDLCPNYPYHDWGFTQMLLQMHMQKMREIKSMQTMHDTVMDTFLKIPQVY